VPPVLDFTQCFDRPPDIVDRDDTRPSKPKASGLPGLLVRPKRLRGRGGLRGGLSSPDDHISIKGWRSSTGGGLTGLTAVPRRVLGQAGLWSRRVVAHYSRRAQRRRTDRVSLRVYPLRAPNNCAEALRRHASSHRRRQTGESTNNIGYTAMTKASASRNTENFGSVKGCRLG
jgi:hypothetical protein